MFTCLMNQEVLTSDALVVVHFKVAQVMDFSVESVSEGQLFALSRLLQLFDYMLHHLYHPPAKIIQLVSS